MWICGFFKNNTLQNSKEPDAKRSGFVDSYMVWICGIFGYKKIKTQIVIVTVRKTLWICGYLLAFCKP